METTIANRNRGVASSEAPQRKPVKKTKERVSYPTNQIERRAILCMLARTTIQAYIPLARKTGYDAKVLKEVCEAEALSHRFDYPRRIA